MPTLLILVTLLLNFLLYGTSIAMERFDVLSTQQMSTLLEDRAAGAADFILVNSLDEIIYRDKSIPGSINIPWSKVTQNAQKLGNDKDKLIITYCMGYR